jgi:hypothetical protein
MNAFKSWFIAFFFICTPAAVSSQRIIGRVIDPNAQKPVHGAFVSLLDLNGQRLRSVLTDTAGRFILIAPSPGTYRLRSERIGQRTILTDSIRVDDGANVPFTIESPTQAIALAGLAASGSRRCTVRAEAAAGAARVWEEARKALDITRWGRENMSVLFRSSVYSRVLHPRTLKVMSETVRGMSGSAERPFRTEDAAFLARYGYVRVGDDRALYFYGLDAQLLLSDLFLDEHCFQLEDGRGEDSGLIGLAFRPLRDGFTPDIEGTLWIDRTTAELRRIDYRFVRAERLIPAGEATGRTEFQRLPSGYWVVDEWWIRAPSVVQSGSRYTVDAIHEDGGVLLSARENRPITLQASLSVVGKVTDATRNHAPLQSATVSLLATDRTIATDSTGAFRLDNIEDGDYDLAFSHPRLDSIPLVRLVQRIRVQAGAAPVTLTTPTLDEIRVALCPDRGARADAGLLWGIVRTPDSTPVFDAKVEMAWIQVVMRGNMPVQNEQTASARTDAQGRFVFCEVAAGPRIHVRAQARDHLTPIREITIPIREIARIDFQVSVTK